jgi:peptidoglycan/LPS O-acetylase OafA/YrhL
MFDHGCNNVLRASELHRPTPAARDGGTNRGFGRFVIPRDLVGEGADCTRREASGIGDMVEQIRVNKAMRMAGPINDPPAAMGHDREVGRPALRAGARARLSHRADSEPGAAGKRHAISGGTTAKVAPQSGIESKPSNASQSSLALSNLRGLVILIVVAFHSVLAYLGSLGPAAFAFDDPPYKWRAFPIVDSHRWFGFDIFCAWQDVYLMALMFFLSALFTWPSLARKGSRKFLVDRILRLGVPFVFALLVVMPLALYPVYRLTAIDPSVAAYAQHLLALPFWPNGPMWFLWLLLALTVVAAGLHRFVPQWVELVARCSASAAVRPGRYFVGLATACVLAYVPLALAFTPWDWSDHGPFALQLSRPLLYAVFYLAGLGIGAYGLERGLLAPDGLLARRWGVWLAGSLAAFLLWMGLTGLAMIYHTAPLGLQVVVDISYALACASGCFFVMAACLRFVTLRSRLLASLADNAFGIYLLHYVFVVWLQYALLGIALLAIGKAAIVFGGALLLAWGAAIAMRLVPIGSRLVGAERIVWTGLPLPQGRMAGSLVLERQYPRDRRQFPSSTLARQ